MDKYTVISEDMVIRNGDFYVEDGAITFESFDFIERTSDRIDYDGLVRDMEADALPGAAPDALPDAAVDDLPEKDLPGAAPDAMPGAAPEVEETDALTEEAPKKESKIAFKVVASIDPDYIRDSRKRRSLFKPEKLQSPEKKPSGVRFRIEKKKEEPTPEKLILVNIEKLRAQGVPEYVLEMIIGCQKELSPVHVTKNGQIYLMDYKIVVNMPPLDRTLYLLYLRHPEGIRFKELCDHKDELMDLYSSLSGRSDPDAISRSIEGLVDPLSNSANEKSSRIKSAFEKALGPELAQNYIIDGKSGEARRISLDRSLIHFETIRSLPY